MPNALQDSLVGLYAEITNSKFQFADSAEASELEKVINRSSAKTQEALAQLSRADDFGYKMDLERVIKDPPQSTEDFIRAIKRIEKTHVKASTKVKITDLDQALVEIYNAADDEGKRTVLKALSALGGIFSKFIEDELADESTNQNLVKEFMSKLTRNEIKVSVHKIRKASESFENIARALDENHYQFVLNKIEESSVKEEQKKALGKLSLTIGRLLNTDSYSLADFYIKTANTKNLDDKLRVEACRDYINHCGQEAAQKSVIDLLIDNASDISFPAKLAEVIIDESLLGPQSRELIYEAIRAEIDQKGHSLVLYSSLINFGDSNKEDLVRNILSSYDNAIEIIDESNKAGKPQWEKVVKPKLIIAPYVPYFSPAEIYERVSKAKQLEWILADFREANPSNKRLQTNMLTVLAKSAKHKLNAQILHPSKDSALFVDSLKALLGLAKD